MNNARKFLQVLTDLEYEEINNFVDTEVREQYYYNFGNYGFSGWKNHIMLTENGRLYLTGSMSSNTMTMDNYEGREIILFSIPSCVDNDFVLNVEMIENELTEEEQKILFDKMLTYLNLDDESKDDYLSLKDINNDYNIELEEKFKELFPTHWENLLNEYIEIDFNYNIFDNFYAEVDYVKSMLEAEAEEEEE